MNKQHFLAINIKNVFNELYFWLKVNNITVIEYIDVVSYSLHLESNI